MQPDSNAEVTILLPADRPCKEQGAVCAKGRKRLSNSLELSIPGPNNPAAGAPVITGTARVGETLTMDTSGVTDQDGMDNVSFTYQWTDGDGDIDGATASTHTLADADEGKTIRIRVSFTDDRGNQETLTSGPPAAVAPKPNSAATGTPTITGTAQAGETLTDTSGIEDTDGLENVVFTYQWTAGGTNIEGAAGSTYTATAEDEGLAIQVRVSFTDDRGNPESLTSEATGHVAGQ